MNFFKVKRVSVKMDGTIVAICTTCEVTKGREYTCCLNEYGQKMTPLFDHLTGDLAGFFNAEEIDVDVTFEED